MRRGTLLKKKSADSRPNDAQLRDLQQQAALANEFAPRLRALMPRSSESSDWGTLVFGPRALFFFDDAKENALPTETNSVFFVPLDCITMWGEANDCLEVTTEGGTVWRWKTDDKLKSSVWCSEAVCFLDSQMLKFQREEHSKGGLRFSFLFAFLEREDDFGSVEVESSLKDLASEETLLFDMRVLSSHPESLSASSVFFEGLRFRAMWSLGSKKTPCIVAVNRVQGIVVLLPMLSVWTVFFFPEIKSFGSKKSSLSLLHVPDKSAPPVLHTFFTPCADVMETTIKTQLGVHFAAKRMPGTMPLLYPPALPADWSQRVGEAGGGAAGQAERSKTIVEQRKKTMKKQMQTIRSKKMQVDSTGLNYATAALGMENEGDKN